MKSSRGVALLLVVFVIALASILVVNMAYSTHLNARASAMVVRSVQAEYLLKSALSLARYLIQEQGPAETGPEEENKPISWQDFANGAPIPTELLGLNAPNLRLEMEIRPQNSKLSLRKLQNDPRTWGPVFVRLFTSLGFDKDEEPDHTGAFPERVFKPEEMVANLIDYFDSDTNSYSSTGEIGSGIESSLPSGFEFANQMISSIEELRNIPGFTPGRLRLLSPRVTLQDIGNVNINLAPADIIKALHKDIDDDMAGRIIEARKSKPFSNEDNYRSKLREILGSVAEEIFSMIDVRSSWYQIIAKAEYGGNFRYFLRATVAKEGGPTSSEPPVVKTLELF